MLMKSMTASLNLTRETVSLEKSTRVVLVVEDFPTTTNGWKAYLGSQITWIRKKHGISVSDLRNTVELCLSLMPYCSITCQISVIANGG